MSAADVFAGAERWCVEHGDCTAALRALPDASVDCVVTDPPYPEIDRDYGRLTERQWHRLMARVVEQCRRALTPRGSAVFVLQPNSERVGRMRPWLWEFVARYAREWNMVQDAWWWNPAALPTVHTHRGNGLMRPSVKACVWLGPADCYRAQGRVLWGESVASLAYDTEDRALRNHPSGAHVRSGRAVSVARERGGATPYNLIPVANSNSTDSAGAEGHGAGTPHDLAAWWVRYLCPPGGVVLDPFAGVGSIGVAAAQEGCRYLGVEKHASYVPVARKRLTAAFKQRSLLEVSA